LASQNALLRRRHEQYDVHGQSLLALSQEARHLLLEDAARYTRWYRDVGSSAIDPVGPKIWLAGHQPQLPHPGVWFKNFVLGALAKHYGGVAVQLLIDNDLVRTASIRVPRGSVASPALESVLLDRPSGEAPYEERPIVDLELFSSLAWRVKQTLAPFVPDPLVHAMWPWAIQAARDTGNLGQSVAQARHRLEGAWGLTTLELPLSRVCDTRPFRRFTFHLLENLGRLHPLYNQALRDYRRANRIRSRSHPVPDLTAQGDWLEAPFWIWSDTSASRRPLFVRQCPDSIHLRAGRTNANSDREPPYEPTIIPRDAPKAIDQMERMRAQGTKLRPRALMTTMYARLVLADLFVHGIGGAKYDQLTDVLIDRFFQIAPPAFLTVSATFRLPIARARVVSEDLQRVESLLRELWYHPERHVVRSAPGGISPAEAIDLVSEKRRWVSMDLPQDQRAARHRAIGELNEQLRMRVAGQREKLLREQDRLMSALRHEAILGSREYAFCLFPEATLRGPLRELATPSAQQANGGR
jgi:hypothetical protein